MSSSFQTVFFCTPYKSCAGSACAWSTQERGPRCKCGSQRCWVSSPENFPEPARRLRFVPSPVCLGSSWSFVSSVVGDPGFVASSFGSILISSCGIRGRQPSLSVSFTSHATSRMWVTVSRWRDDIAVWNMALAFFWAASFGDARHRRYKAA